ncbi:MAG: SMI1/KNR4 family protein [Candidatus Cloacimonadales bacterium]|nr:SMI1/KNR4 family protein [Candidatus Cloacimonadales bacterium]
MLKNDLSNILKKLESKIQENPEKFHFEPPAKEEDIARKEFLLGIELPLSYREFLKNFNGGFICNNFLAAKIKIDNDIETARWNSLVIFSLEELYDEYIDLNDRNWKMPLEWDGVYPIIPFGRTAIQELLVFAAPLNAELESPVFDAFHEDPISDWEILYKNFTEFLDDYLSKEGNIKTVAPVGADTMDKFLPESGWKQRPDEWEDPEKILKYNFELLKIEPDNNDAFLNIAEVMNEKEEFLSAKFYLGKALQIDPDDDYAYYMKGRIMAKQNLYNEAVQALSEAISLADNPAFYYTIRSNYYMELEQFEKALLDCDNSLEYDPDNGYAYFCRAEAATKLNKHQQAFEDIRKAVELEPDNALSLTILADYYMEKNEYQKVVTICNEAIKYDPIYLRPHITLEKAYRLLGETEKAEAEDIEIEEILNGDFI